MGAVEERFKEKPLKSGKVIVLAVHKQVLKV
jgi:hypothetical protein